MKSAKAIIGKDSPYKDQIKNIYKLVDKSYGEGEFFKTYPRFLIPFKMEIEKEELIESIKLIPLLKI